MGISFAQERDSLYTEEVYQIVDEDPTYVGGWSEFMKFVHEHMVYDAIEPIDPLQTKIFVQFIIASDGTPHSFKVVNKSITEESKMNLIEQLQHMPKWNPGKLENKPVATLVTMPIQIHLN